MKKQEFLERLKVNAATPVSLDQEPIQGITYPDTLAQYVAMSKRVGCRVVEASADTDLNDLVHELCPQAKRIASNLKEITADVNPDHVDTAAELNHTDVGVLRAELGVAENGCVWLPQTMKERAVMFISEELVIFLDRNKIVDNMHQAYNQVKKSTYGYGVFMSGPSKTADIEQALVMGAQAARAVTIVLIDSK